MVQRIFKSTLDQIHGWSKPEVKFNTGIASKTKSRRIGLFASHVDQLCRILQKLRTLNLSNKFIITFISYFCSQWIYESKSVCFLRIGNSFCIRVMKPRNEKEVDGWLVQLTNDSIIKSCDNKVTLSPIQFQSAKSAISFDLLGWSSLVGRIDRNVPRACRYPNGIHIDGDSLKSK